MLIAGQWWWNTLCFFFFLVYGFEIFQDKKKNKMIFFFLNSHTQHATRKHLYGSQHKNHRLTSHKTVALYSCFNILLMLNIRKHQESDIWTALDSREHPARECMQGSFPGLGTPDWSPTLLGLRTLLTSKKFSVCLCNYKLKCHWHSIVWTSIVINTAVPLQSQSHSNLFSDKNR